MFFSDAVVSANAMVEAVYYDQKRQERLALLQKE